MIMFLSNAKRILMKIKAKILKIDQKEDIDVKAKEKKVKLKALQLIGQDLDLDHTVQGPARKHLYQCRMNRKMKIENWKNCAEIVWNEFKKSRKESVNANLLLISVMVKLI